MKVGATIDGQEITVYLDDEMLRDRTVHPGRWYLGETKHGENPVVVKAVDGGWVGEYVTVPVRLEGRLI